ncbi:hypothetical protein [Nocardioides sp. SYSU D00065]|uniref:hypothetical protein n=1 Tax=Nocardioides sp. SYSU D00065 TaxID=2817378 RepID=UPI001B340C5A|nr:hypothetical protein [Nocardioides sp. SYSU D00065]
MIGTSDTIDPAAAAVREHERIALAALTAHIFENALDVPHSINIDRFGFDARSIVLSIHHESAPAWCNSIAIDHEAITAVENTDLFGRPMNRHTVTGRLPDLGIRVTVRFFQSPPRNGGAHLTAVGA